MVVNTRNSGHAVTNQRNGGCFMKHYSGKESKDIRHNPYLFVWLFIAVFNLGSSANAAPATYDSLLQEALGLRNAGDFAGAEQTLRNARTLAVDTNEIDYLLGMTLAFQERFDEALQVLSSALASYPNDIQLQIARARVFSYQGEYEKALKVTEEVLEVDPGNSEATILQARVSYYQKDYQRAHRSYAQVLGGNPENVTALLGLYDVEYALGNSDEALALLDRAATADPFNLDVKSRLERGTPTQQLPNEINIGYAISNIDGAALSNWYDRTLEYRHHNRGGNQFFIRGEHLNRFGSHDTLAEIGSIINWGSDSPLEMAVAFSNDSDFSPEQRFRLATSVKVLDSVEGLGTSLLDLSFSQAEYQTGNVKTGRLGVTHYFSGFNGWFNTAALWVRDENNLSSVGWTSGINWQTSSRIRLGYAFTDAPETENNITTDTETHHLYASYQLADGLAFRLDGSRNARENSYNRDSLSLSLQFRF